MLQRIATRAVTLAFLTALGLPAVAQASTAAGTTITNVATVSFNDASGVAQTAVTASADVVVTLVAAIPTLDTPADFGIAQGSTGTITYTITSGANGPDDYTVTEVDTPTNVTLVVPAPAPASFRLGATTLAADANGTNQITVPFDGTNDSICNDIAVGDTVVIGGVAYAVNVVTEPAVVTPNVTTTLTLGAVVPAGPLVGALVGERRTFTVDVPSGTVAVGQTSGAHSVATTVTAAGAGNPSASDTVVVTVTRPSLTVTKEVSLTGNAGDFHASVNAAPTTTPLYYRITVTNSGTVNALAVAVSDPMPVYLAYTPGSAKAATATGLGYTDVGVSALTDASDGLDEYTYTVLTRTVLWAPTPEGDPLAPGNSIVLFFMATVR